MPHMANLPWISFYFLISIALTLFWAKENFSFSSKITHLKTAKITHNSMKWIW